MTHYGSKDTGVRTGHMTRNFPILLAVTRVGNKVRMQIGDIRIDGEEPKRKPTIDAIRLSVKGAVGSVSYRKLKIWKCYRDNASQYMDVWTGVDRNRTYRRRSTTTSRDTKGQHLESVSHADPKEASPKFLLVKQRSLTDLSALQNAGID
ncbi:hypothetical protein N9B94_00065 [Verrucomicrobia bacterium]|nr:hypothetical protein [Verrucomicrobiota bacterium]